MDPCLYRTTPTISRAALKNSPFLYIAHTGSIEYLFLMNPLFYWTDVCLSRKEKHAHTANISRKWAKTGYFIGNLRVAKMSHWTWSVTLCQSMSKSSIIPHSSYPYILVVSYLWYKATLLQVTLDILGERGCLIIELILIVQEVGRRVVISFYFFLRKRCQWLFFKS